MRYTNHLIYQTLLKLPCCDVHYDFHINTMFSSSLPPVFYLRYLWFLRILVSGTRCVEFFSVMCTYPTLPVSLDWPFLIAPSKDKGNRSTYYHKFSAQSIQRTKTISKLGEELKFYIPSQYEKIEIWIPYRNKIANNIMAHQKPIKMNSATRTKNCIKLDEK